ncbi:MAG: hypothetical protein ABIA04_11750 [Pseudomonadota bacterium]
MKTKPLRFLLYVFIVLSFYSCNFNNNDSNTDQTQNNDNYEINILATIDIDMLLSNSATIDTSDLITSDEIISPVGVPVSEIVNKSKKTISRIKNSSSDYLFMAMIVDEDNSEIIGLAQISNNTIDVSAEISADLTFSIWIVPGIANCIEASSTLTTLSSLDCVDAEKISIKDKNGTNLLKASSDVDLDFGTLVYNSSNNQLISFIDTTETEGISESTSTSDDESSDEMKLFAGGDNSCVIQNGIVKCWGDSDLLGNSGTSDIGTSSSQMGISLLPIDLDNFEITQMDIQETHACALSTGNIVYCWGLAENAVLGRTGSELIDNATIVAVDLGMNFLAQGITVGGSFSCAYGYKTSDFSAGIKCWGQNTNGVLGLKDTQDRGDSTSEMGNNLPFVEIGSYFEVLKMDAGTNHVCALLKDINGKEIKCWGNNEYGQCGYNSTGNPIGDDASDSFTAINLGDANKIPMDMCTGNQFSCALLSGNGIKCWGRNDGNLGYENTTDINDPSGSSNVDLGNNTYATAISCGNDHVCTLTSVGRVKCWGIGTYGRLGYENSETIGDEASEMGSNLSAVSLGYDLTASEISLGSEHTCVLIDEDCVKCWGNNSSGELGQGLAASENIGDQTGEMGDNLSCIELGSF